MLATRWFEGVHHCHQYGQSYVLATVLEVIGSSPREFGAKMLITAEQTVDTIGGGQLEFDVIKLARERLAQKVSGQETVNYPLASKLGQCCGGKVSVLFEVFYQHTQHVAVFGAGHVAKQVIPILGQMSVKVDWIDSRSEVFPDNVPNNVGMQIHDEPQWLVNQLPEQSWVFIMTHCHQLDFDILRHCLQRPDIPYIGLIGSETKSRKFRQRLAHRDIDVGTRLECPIGLSQIPGKKPIEVAVSICARVITLLNPEQTEMATEHTDMEQRVFDDAN
jgi:xanthine dehydrogenase accessory factor